VAKDAIISKDIRRGLLLITKIIQNLANNVMFGIKESFLTGLNEFLAINITRVHEFLREISSVCLCFPNRVRIPSLRL
jgi:neurofibromin 1